VAGRHAVAAEGAHCVRKKAVAAGIVGEAAAGRTVVAGRPAARSSDGSSAQIAVLPVEDAASDRADGGRSVAGRAEDAALPATAAPGSRPAAQEDLLAEELEALYTALDFGGYSQPEGLVVAHYNLWDAGREQTRGDFLYLLERHRPEAGPGVGDIRTADSVGRSSAVEGPLEVEEVGEGTGTAGSQPSSLDGSAPCWTRYFDGPWV
jgi:hypothetical protein